MIGFQDISIETPDKDSAMKLCPIIVSAFQKETKIPFATDDYSVSDAIDLFYDNMFIVVATVNSFPVAGMCSLAWPSIFNEDILSSQELFFWVDLALRNTPSSVRIAKSFLEKHEEWVDEKKIAMPCLSSLVTSPKSVERMYMRLGYEESEKSFTKYIKWQ